MATGYPPIAADDRPSAWLPGLLDYEARLIARTVAKYGVLERHQLYELTHAGMWRGASFARVCEYAVTRGMIRDLGLGFYAAPRRRD